MHQDTVLKIVLSIVFALTLALFIMVGYLFVSEKIPPLTFSSYGKLQPKNS